MDFKQILYEVEDKIATVTLNRPDRLNAMNKTMNSEIREVLDRVNEDDDVRALIVTGAGRAFCAGADMAAGKGSSFAIGTDMETHRDGGGIVTLKLYQLKKPVIAAINGPAVGFGMTMTLAMDIRLASEDAKMGLVFVRRGIVPEACSTWFLPRIVGISKALEWGMSGRVFSAREALEGGLVSRVLPHDQLLHAARELAHEMADNCSPVAVALTRQLMWSLLGEDHPIAAHRLDSKSVFYMSRNADSQEGVESFLEKRPPKFTMKPSKDMPDFYPWLEEPPFLKPDDK
jgi:enoyl-CoA hydratase/carnithine racemase